LKDLPRFGRPEVIAKDSWQSNALRAAVLQDEEHQAMTFSEVAQELGIVTARSTIEKVMYEHHQNSDILHGLSLG